MPAVSKPFTFSAGAVIIASQHNSCFDTLYNLVNGSLDGTNFASNAAIADTQLAQITTAGKVAGAAITLASTSIVTAASNDYALIGDTSDSGNPKKALVSDFAYTPTTSNALSGSVIQTLNQTVLTKSTGTTVMPWDDTVPQNTEGDQYLTLAITPTNASNKLVINVIANLSHSNNSSNMGLAIFQDSTAGALAATQASSSSAANGAIQMSLTWYMAAGTTSATTFNIRIGGSLSGTTTFNGAASGRIFGGVMASMITIQEIKT